MVKNIYFLNDELLFELFYMLEFHRRIATKTTLHSIVPYKINEKTV